jgi:hypothetical protein
MEAFEDDDEFEEDYKDRSSLHDVLLRKIGMFCQRCIENKRLMCVCVCVNLTSSWDRLP